MLVYILTYGKKASDSEFRYHVRIADSNFIFIFFLFLILTGLQEEFQK